MNDDGGEQLGEGGWTEVVRIGDTVRRPVRPFTATVQQYLAHLHAQGFDAAPVPLGYDDAGREVLSYVQGDISVEPLPAEAFGLDTTIFPCQSTFSSFKHTLQLNLVETAG